MVDNSDNNSNYDGCTFEEDKEAAKDAGMNGFIVKPINIEKLIDILSYN